MRTDHLNGPVMRGEIVLISDYLEDNQEPIISKILNSKVRIPTKRLVHLS